MTQDSGEVIGVDTIKGLVGTPPKEIAIPEMLPKTQTKLTQWWNSVFIAILPYCYSCKDPLVWHTLPGDKVKLHCAKCGRKWSIEKKNGGEK